MLKIWLKCTACDTSSHPHLFKSLHATGGGFHIKARCPACGAYIKFISKANFTQSEINDLRSENNGEKTIGEQHDIFK